MIVVIISSMKQKELAEILGISRSYLNGILRKKRKPSLELAEKISKLSSIKVTDLRPDILENIKKYL